MSTGPHFNPFGKKHGAPWMEERHSGDLGNVEATADGCEFTIEDSQIPSPAPTPSSGRACAIHELEDDLAKATPPRLAPRARPPRPPATRAPASPAASSASPPSKRTRM